MGGAGALTRAGLVASAVLMMSSSSCLCRSGGLLELGLRTLDDHVFESGAGGDHREDVVLLHHLGVDDAGPVAVGHRGLQHAIHVGRAANAKPLDPVGL